MMTCCLCFATLLSWPTTRNLPFNFQLTTASPNPHNRRSERNLI